MFTGVQEKLGILNNGAVYAVFSYEAHNSDELSFNEGDRLVVLRKGDEWEREWWWARLNDQEGYIPRNLLGVSLLLLSNKIMIHLLLSYVYSYFLKSTNVFTVPAASAVLN